MNATSPGGERMFGWDKTLKVNIILRRAKCEFDDGIFLPEGIDFDVVLFIE